MAYLESTRDMRESQLPDDVIWEDVMMIMRQQINQLAGCTNEAVREPRVGTRVLQIDGYRDVARMKAGSAQTIQMFEYLY